MAFTKNEIETPETHSHTSRGSLRSSGTAELRQEAKDSGHLFTYVGLFAFTFIVYFRPYEMFPSLAGFAKMAFWVSILTLVIYLVTQFSTHMTLTTWTTEVKCVTFIALSALIMMPLAKDVSLAWKTFDEYLSKILIIFIIMANVLTTRRRIMGLMWLGIGIGVYLSYQAYDLYLQGIFAVEEYRVGVDFGGMFGNPNDMSIHLVMFIPIAVILGLSSSSVLAKIVYGASACIMVYALILTQSRGGFIGLVAVLVLLVWKLFPKRRISALALAIIIGIGLISIAPGNYSARVLSIFDSSMDVSGSSSQRQELLERSILVTIRNPLGIGLGNFPIVGVRNLQTHNAYTQVGSELGWFALGAYIILLVTPIRCMSRIGHSIGENQARRKDFLWAVGIQAAIVGYMFASFFGSVAYHWYVYFPIAYAVGFDHIINEQDLDPTDSIG